MTAAYILAAEHHTALVQAFTRCQIAQGHRGVGGAVVDLASCQAQHARCDVEVARHHHRAVQTQVGLAEVGGLQSVVADVEEARSVAAAHAVEVERNRATGAVGKTQRVVRHTVGAAAGVGGGQGGFGQHVAVNDREIISALTNRRSRRKITRYACDLQHTGGRVYTDDLGGH